MALSKITLKLGKKTIELTPEQFEELKQDMRILDKQHHYHWNWYKPWYNGGSIRGAHQYDSVNVRGVSTPLSTFSPSNYSSVGRYETLAATQGAGVSNEEKPEPFKGVVLSTE